MAEPSDPPRPTPHKLRDRLGRGDRASPDMVIAAAMAVGLSLAVATVAFDGLGTSFARTVGAVLDLIAAS